MNWINKTRFWQTSKNGDQIIPRCYAIMFKNVGDQAAIINGVWRLEPGEQTPTMSMMSPDIVDETEYQINFDSSVGTAPLVNAIIMEVYPVLTKNGRNASECKQF